MIYSTTGKLKYSENKLIVSVEEDITSYYRNLMGIKINKPRYPAHITVLRDEKIKNNENWGKRSEINYCYSSIIKKNEIYCWLDVYSKDLEEIRISLGLERYSPLSCPPDGTKCFHITIGNFKNV